MSRVKRDIIERLCGLRLVLFGYPLQVVRAPEYQETMDYE